MGLTLLRSPERNFYHEGSIFIYHQGIIFRLVICQLSKQKYCMHILHQNLAPQLWPRSWPICLRWVSDISVQGPPFG